MEWANRPIEGQVSLFDILNGEAETFHLGKKPVRLIECFAGIGSQMMALRDLGIKTDNGKGGEGAYKVIEFDKYAIASYNAIHHTNHKVADICDVRGEDLGIVDKEHFTYLLTYSFPCTDLSVAGKMLGMNYDEWKSGEATRSGLLWEVKRLLDETPHLPQVLLMENVPQVHGAKNKADWDRWLNYLDGKGYNSYYQDLNASDYGIPQSRKRCFCVSILGNYKYEFPAPIPLETVMRDYLEEEVDEKYYITSDRAYELIDSLVKGNRIPEEYLWGGCDLSSSNPRVLDVANAITTKDRSIQAIPNRDNGVYELNPMDDGTCRTIKAQYGQTSTANFVRGGHSEQQE